MESERSTVSLKDLLSNNYRTNPKKINLKRARNKKSFSSKRPHSDDNDKYTYGTVAIEYDEPMDIDRQFVTLKRNVIYNNDVEFNSVDIDEIMHQHLRQFKEPVSLILLDCFRNKVEKNLQPNLRNKYLSAIKKHREEIRSLFSLDAVVDVNVANVVRETFDTIQKTRRQCFPITVQARAPVPWHQNVLNSRNFMRHNLFVCDVSMKKLKELWNKSYEDVILVLVKKFEDGTSSALSFEQLHQLTDDICLEAKLFLLERWLPQCSSVLQKKSATVLNYSEGSIKKFFGCVHSLMSRQLRQFVFRLFFHVVDFINSYRVQNNPYTIGRNFKLIKKPFVTVKLKYELAAVRRYYSIQPDFKEFYFNLRRVYIKILSISSDIPRIERFVFKNNNNKIVIGNYRKSLYPVRITEHVVQTELSNLLDSCWFNAADPPAYMTNYESLVNFINVDAENRLKTFISNDNISLLQECFSLMNEYKLLRRDIMNYRATVALNMIDLDCSEMNAELLGKVYHFEETVITHVTNNFQNLNRRIIEKYEEIAQNVSEIPDDSQLLVSLCNYITGCKTTLLLDLVKKLNSSSEYICFVIDYARLTDEQITLNSKTFRWPQEMDTILKSASLTIAKKKEIAENILRGKVKKFNADVEEHAKELKIFKKKDPPLLSITELKETVTRIDSLMTKLEDDIRIAEEIQTEEELLSTETSYNKDVYNMLNTLKPYSELWHTALKFYSSYEIWYNGPYKNLNVENIKHSVEGMEQILLNLSDVFANILGTRRVLQMVLTKLQYFHRYIPMLELLCNPGLKERHWQKISELKAMELSTANISSLADFVDVGVDDCFNELKNIHEIVSKEYELEQNLFGIKDKWNYVVMSYSTDENGKIVNFTEIDGIQQILDDHLLRVQVMRASQYIAPIESDVEMWEDKLILIQDILDHLLQVQATIMYLKPLFTNTDDNDVEQQDEGGEISHFKQVCDIWSRILHYVECDSKILSITECPNIMNDLKYCIDILDQVKMKQNQYLDKKRQLFPRFFFLSNRELMEILSKGLSKIETHLKCFPGISSLEFNKDFSAALSMISESGEMVALNDSINLSEDAGKPEIWLKRLDKVMVDTLKHLSNRALESYRISESWIFKWPEMIIQCVSHIKWTSNTELAIQASSLSKLYSQYNDDRKRLLLILNEASLNRRNRRMVSNLILFFVYACETLTSLIETGCLSIRDFNWICRLKIYNEDTDGISLRTLSTTIPFGYEYLGNTDRLIVTSLTEKYYRFMLLTIDQECGLVLHGKYGTGKTSLCRDLSYIAGRPFLNFNCSSNVTPAVLEMFIKGIAQTGFWFCFQEFDKMKRDHLGVFSEMINSLYETARMKKPFVEFKKSVEFSLESDFAVFLTTSETRNAELPISLRNTFHLLPITEQNLSSIAKNSILSFGVKDSNTLVKKVLHLLQNYRNLAPPIVTCSVSNMKIVKRIILTAQYFKEHAANDDLSDDLAILKAVNYVCSKTIFPKNVLKEHEILTESSTNELFHDSLCEFVKNRNLCAIDDFIENIEELYRLLRGWRAVILTGDTLTGKTETYKVLVDFLSASKIDKLPFGQKVSCKILCPASMTTDQLYGSLSTTHQWSDGVLTRTIRETMESTGSEDETWIVLDGPMDNRWTEGLITMVDENGQLCLASGEIIRITDGVRFIFETDRLDHVSPALLYRCSIVHFKSEIISWTNLLPSFIDYLRKQSNFSIEQCAVFNEIIGWLVPAILEFLDAKCQMAFKLSKNGLFLNFTRLIKCIVEEYDANTTTISMVDMQCLIIFSLIWSYAGNITVSSERLYDTYFRSLLLGNVDRHPKPSKFKLTKVQLFPEKRTVYDWKYELKRNGSAWVPWRTDESESSDNEHSFFTADEIFVRTDNSARQLYFLKLMLHFQLPVLLLGDSDSGATALVKSYLSNLLADKHVTNEINISACPSVDYISSLILSRINRRRKGVYGPDIGKTYITFIDDIAVSGNTNEQRILFEFLRQLFAEKYLYDCQNYSRISLVDTLFIGSLRGKIIGNVQQMTNRFLSRFNVICLHALEQNAITDIFTAILRRHFSDGFPEQILNLSNGIVKATVGIYDRVKSDFTTTVESNAHYVFGLHDIHNVMNGIRLMPAETCQSVDEILRLWVHEILRNFGDKLTTNSDREKLLEIIKWSSYKYLRQNVNEYLGHLIGDGEKRLTISHLRNLLFSNFLNKIGNNKPAYDEITNTDLLMECVKRNIEKYSELYYVSFPMIPFRYVAEHVCRIVRSFYIGRGHLVTIGPEGSGRRTTIKLSSIIADFDVLQIKTNSHYGVENWSSDLKCILFQAAFGRKPVVFVLSDDQLLRRDTFKDDLNVLLNTEDLPYLYSLEDKSDIYDKMVEIFREQSAKMEMSPSVVYSLFVKRVKQNLRIAFVMSSVNSDSLRTYFDKYPSFVKCVTLNWFEPWPEDALINIASVYLCNELSEETVLRKCYSVSSKIHQYSADLSRRLRRENPSLVLITCDTYLNFLSTFLALYKEKLIKITDLKNRYEKGLKILQYAAEQVSTMQNKLQVLKPNLMTTSDAMEKLIIKIEQNTIAIESSKEIVAADEALANEAAAAAQAIRDDCESDLSEAEPALHNAIEALNTLKPADINIIKSMKNPPAIIKLVLESICIMKGMKPEYKINTLDDTVIEDYWSVSLKLLGDSKFLENLKNYDRDNIDPAIMKTIRERYIPHLNFNPDVVKNVSNACEGLCNWVRAIEIYDRVIKIVKPKQVKLAEAETEYTFQMERLNKKRSQLTEVMEKLQSLRDELAEKTKKKKQLEDSISDCLKKLQRAEKLISNLSSEKQRWFEADNRLRITTGNAVGDSLLSSAIIVYLASFDFNIKKDCVNSWKLLFDHFELSLSHDFSLLSTFYETDDDHLHDISNALVDDVSIENGVIVEKCQFYPILIDPQGIGTEFIRTIMKDNNLQLVNEFDEDYVEIIKNCAIQGRPIMIENFSEDEYEDLCDIICRGCIQRNGKRYMVFQNEVVMVREKFKLYMICRQHNPKFDLELMSKVTLVNFTLTYNRMRQQLLQMIIQKDAPDLLKNKKHFTSEWTKACKILTETEDTVLSMVCTEQQVLDDETTIATLSSLKTLLDEIEEKRENLTEAEKRIKRAHKDYDDICNLIANVYFCILQVVKLNTNYYFPLKKLIQSFYKCTEGSKICTATLEGKQSIVKSFVHEVFYKVSINMEDYQKILLASILSFQITHSSTD